MQTLKLLRSPDSGWMQIAHSIESNPGLVVKVLRTVNSMALGLHQVVSNISHAVSLLGRSKMEPLVLVFVVASKVPVGRAARTGLDVDKFWQTASRRASVGRALAELIEPQAQSEAFVGGLLQDIAVPFLAAARPKEYGPILEHWQHEAGVDLDALEKEEFGWDHSDVGACIAQRWEFPAALGMAIDSHHLLDDDVPPTAIQLVSLLDEPNVAMATDAIIDVCPSSYPVSPDRVSESMKLGLERAAGLAKMLTSRRR